MDKTDFYEGKPVRSLQTMLRTVAHTEPGLLSVIPDGCFSPRTAEAVARFQQKHRLPVTGIADEATWDALVCAYETAKIDAVPAQSVQIHLRAGQVIRRGEENHKLYLVQAMLLTLSFLAEELPEPELSGELDEPTRAALVAFQLRAGLSPTGEVDKTTWKALALQFAAASDELSRRTGE